MAPRELRNANARFAIHPSRSTHDSGLRADWEGNCSTGVEVPCRKSQVARILSVAPNTTSRDQAPGAATGQTSARKEANPYLSLGLCEGTAGAPRHLKEKPRHWANMWRGALPMFCGASILFPVEPVCTLASCHWRNEACALSPGVVCRVADLPKSFACPRCKALMDEVVSIAPLVSEPGLIGYECPACCYVTSVILPPKGAPLIV
jgi:hypothetical protein